MICICTQLFISFQVLPLKDSPLSGLCPWQYWPFRTSQKVAVLQSIYHAQLDCRQPYEPKFPEGKMKELRDVVRPTVQHLSDSEDDAPQPQAARNLIKQPLLLMIQHEYHEYSSKLCSLVFRKCMPLKANQFKFLRYFWRCESQRLRQERTAQNLASPPWAKGPTVRHRGSTPDPQRRSFVSQAKADKAWNLV